MSKPHYSGPDSCTWHKDPRDGVTYCSGCNPDRHNTIQLLEALQNLMACYRPGLAGDDEKIKWKAAKAAIAKATTL